MTLIKNDMARFRHEVKHEINYLDMLTLRTRLAAAMLPDAHGAGGRYEVRSLYFDSPSDKALYQKFDGVKRREKYRIRMYDFDDSYISLQRKFRDGAMSAKDQAQISRPQMECILREDYDWIKESSTGLLFEFYHKVLTDGLRPKVIVDYTREAFTCQAGNVRVTLDYNIRAGAPQNYFDPYTPTLPTRGPWCILEVKWDDFLPDFVRDLIYIPGRRTAAFSKYAACRVYG